jgi:nitrogen fixation NifU-like protein
LEDLTEVYNDLIMEHSMNSYNKKKLEAANYCEVGHNPNCGDEITLELKVKDNIIEDMAFLGHGCDFKTYFCILFMKFFPVYL